MFSANSSQIKKPSPAFTYLGSQFAQGNFEPGFTVSKPSFMESGAVAIIAVRDGFGTAGRTIDTPAGWTQLGFANSGWTNTGGFFAKKVTNSDWPVSFTATNTIWQWVVAGYASCDIDNFGSIGTGVPTTSLAAITPTNSGKLLILALQRTSGAFTISPSETQDFDLGVAAFWSKTSTGGVSYGGWDVAASQSAAMAVNLKA